MCKACKKRHAGMQGPLQEPNSPQMVQRKLRDRAVKVCEDRHAEKESFLQKSVCKGETLHMKLLR